MRSSRFSVAVCALIVVVGDYLIFSYHSDVADDLLDATEVEETQTEERNNTIDVAHSELLALIMDAPTAAIDNSVDDLKTDEPLASKEPAPSISDEQENSDNRDATATDDVGVSEQEDISHVVDLKSASPLETGNKKSANGNSLNLESSKSESLLELAEQGATPAIEIAWPNSASERERLFTTLHQCIGMKVARINRDGKILAIEASASKNALSGLVRLSSGILSDRETRLLRRLGTKEGMPARLYPRRFDSQLLQALDEQVGLSRHSEEAITGRYRVIGDDLFVENVKAGSRVISKNIFITQLQNCLI